MKARNAFNLLLAAATSAALPTATLAATPEVTSVAMAQSSMSRLVTITYTLANAPAVVTLDVQTNANTSAAASDPGWTSIGGEAVCNAQGDVWKKVAPELTEGNSFNGTITWRPDLSWPDHKIASGGARAVVTAWALDNTPDYMVVDVSAAAQPNTQNYYPSADFVPGGVSNGLYKTTTILMRKIMAKDIKWTMGSVSETGRTATKEATHQVTLTNNYYIGVYEVTQTQWEQTTGYNPSRYTGEKTMRPVENVSFTDIRQGKGTQSTAASATGGVYPAPPYGESFLGLLRTKTGIDFDLPSEAQWEFAARAGNGEGRWGDGTEIRISNDGQRDANLNVLGRYKFNGGKIFVNGVDYNPETTCGATNGTANVGSYKPNNWGLYDMQGNVSERCLDWYEANIGDYDGKVNISFSAPANTLSGEPGENRVTRDSGWPSDAKACRPASRGSYNPATRSEWGNGFRVVCTAGLR